MTQSRLVEASMRTHQGRVRSNNQDFVAWREPDEIIEIDEAGGKSGENGRRAGWLYILADGAGGMDAGEVASRYATERTLHHYLADNEEQEWSRRLYKAMQAANTDLRELSARNEGNSRMATTMVAAVIEDDQAHVANVGDSRAYLWRQGKLQQVTKDQSLVAQLVDEGAITAEEAANHPQRNVILYSLGSERTPRIDLFKMKLEPGDKLLLCSDGLIRHVNNEEIGLVLAQQSPAEATETLINLANERGGQDNISVGVLLFRPTSPAARVVSAQNKREIAELSRGARAFLWLFTFVLSILQSILIFAVWLLLRL